MWRLFAKSWQEGSVEQLKTSAQCERKSRRITGLISTLLTENPPTKTIAASRKSKSSAVKRGYAYERKVAKLLRRWNDALPTPGEFHAATWFHFVDANGRGYAQPDIFIVFPHLVLLVECKLSQTDTAWDQLMLLYKPLLEHHFKRQVVCLQVCKNLYVWPAKQVRHPQNLLDDPRPDMWTWHYLGD